MRKKLAVVITTYNRKDMVDRCIESLLQSDCKLFDLYVIDNAGEDGTYTYLRKKYGNKIRCKRLKLNFGGCNGFREGIIWALKKRYEYLTLCDDDIVVAPETLPNMLEFMEKHPEAGVVGPLTYRMDNKELLQEYGTYLGWGSQYNITVDNYSMTLDEKRCKPWIYVDYIPACLMMIRREPLVKSDGISIDYGGYFEDIDLGHKIVLLGYKICVCRNAPIWHGKVSATGFTRFTTNKDYFMNRSKLLFFIRYTKRENVKEMCELYLNKMFELLHSAKYKKDENTFNITMEGFVDGFAGKLGATYLENVQLDKKEYITIEQLCKDGDCIYLDEYIDGFFILPIMRNMNCEIYVKDEKYNSFCKEMIAYNISTEKVNRIKKFSDNPNAKFDMKIRQYDWMGNSVYEEGYTYIDKYQNIVQNSEDNKFFYDINARKKEVVDLFGPVVVAKAFKIREDWRKFGRYDFLRDDEIKMEELFEMDEVHKIDEKGKK